MVHSLPKYLFRLYICLPILSGPQPGPPHAATEILNLILQAAMIQAINCSIQRSQKTKTKWDHDIPMAVLQAAKKGQERILFIWKEAGKRRGDNTLAVASRRSSRAVRSAHRRHNALKWNQQYRDILDATTRYPKLFNKLIRQHQTTQSQANAIMVSNVLITDQDQAATEWANYYKDLATPKEKSIWDTDSLCSAEQQLHVAYQYATSYQSQPSISYH